MFGHIPIFLIQKKEPAVLGERSVGSSVERVEGGGTIDQCYPKGNYLMFWRTVPDPLLYQALVDILVENS
ncbi:MAG TPA: hypothetical protein VMG34_03645 [Bacteroidota bacterium]|nr:hypothetical protein [Bacteroidota bacterium]